MEIIKLGDRLTVPGKNIKGEVAYIGETHFGNGTWFGLILDDPIGKHNGTIQNIHYFKCPENQGMFIKASYFERECGDINKAVEKQQDLSPKIIKHLKNLKGSHSLKSETALRGSKHLAKRKIETESQNKSNYVVGDNVTNINVDNTETGVTESGDNQNVSGEKVVKFVRRYPNYLNASSHIEDAHFCLNKCKGKEYGDSSAHISNRYLIAPIRERKNNLENDENGSPMRISYPNYLKSSSMLTGKHFCIAKISDINRIKNTAENDTCENPYAYLIKFPYQPRNLPKFKINYPRVKTITSKSMPEIEHLETVKGNYMKCIREINWQLEKVKRENKQLKIRLQRTEASLEEVKSENEHLNIRLQGTEASLEDALKKYSEAQKEMQYLKYDNEYKNKQIKFQKNYLKILSVVEGNSFKKSRKTYKGMEINENFENNVIAHTHDTNSSERKFELESYKDATSVEELQEQNRLMIQGLVELRAFLQTQCKSQFNEPEPVLLNEQYHNSRNKNRSFSKSLHTTDFLNPKLNAIEESEREYSEILKEMTQYNKLTKEKVKTVKKWEETNLNKDTHYLQKPDFNDIDHPAYLSTQQSLCVSGFDEYKGNYNNPNIKEYDPFQGNSALQEKGSGIQRSYEPSFEQSSHHNHCETQISRNTDHYLTDNIAFESADFIPNLSDQISTEDSFYGGEFSLSNTTIIEQEIPEYLKSTDQGPGLTMNLPCMTQSSDYSPMMLPKMKTSERKTAHF